MTVGTEKVFTSEFITMGRLVLIHRASSMPSPVVALQSHRTGGRVRAYSAGSNRPDALGFPVASSETVTPAQLQVCFAVPDASILAAIGEVIIWITAKKAAGTAISAGRSDAATNAAAMLNSFLLTVKR